MNVNYIDYSATGYFAKPIVDYLNQNSKLSPFIAFNPDIEGFRRAIAKRNFTGDRKILAEAIEKQYQKTLGGDIPDAVKENLALLEQSNTFTITTGHQLNIFTGPLYFIFKIVTAINLAKELKEKFPEKNFVPVYWPATEDHDFEEINHTEIQGRKIHWNENATGATGRLSTKTLSEAVKEYKSCLGISANSQQLSDLIDKAYCSNKTLAEATRYFVHSLFKAYGLIIIDADDRVFKKQFADVIKRDLLESNSFKNITESSEMLRQAGYKTQVNAREVNFFYLLDNLRERIVLEGEKYFVLNTDISFSKEEMICEIEDYPERFSPNVILRPLYQELILPNIAYIGGGAEIVYWLQLKSNFDFYEVDFPVLILRNSALIATEGFSQKLSRLGLNPEDLFRDTELIKREWVLKNSEHILNLEDEMKDFRCVFERLKLRTYKIDPTLTPSTQAVKVRLMKALSNLEKKMIKAEKRNHQDALSQLDSIKSKYFPANGLQERKENFGSFYVKYGPSFIEMLIKVFKPLDFKFTILEP